MFLFKANMHEKNYGFVIIIQIPHYYSSFYWQFISKLIKKLQEKA